MKANITLNIGLETCTGNPVEIHHAIHEIERAGVTLLASGVVLGEWEGKQEQTLVLQGLAFDSPELLPRLYLASRALSQHCIAIWHNGKGELIGDNPAKWDFDADLFHFHAREPRAEILAAIADCDLSECERIQAKHKAKADKLDKLGYSKEIPLEVNGYTKESFLAFLRDTLIPDLKESGHECTAEDFETAIEFIEG